MGAINLLMKQEIGNVEHINQMIDEETKGSYAQNERRNSNELLERG
jgi:hypothetical protein